MKRLGQGERRQTEGELYTYKCSSRSRTHQWSIRLAGTVSDTWLCALRRAKALLFCTLRFYFFLFLSFNVIKFQTHHKSALFHWGGPVHGYGGDANRLGWNMMLHTRGRQQAQRLMNLRFYSRPWAIIRCAGRNCFPRDLLHVGKGQVGEIVGCLAGPGWLGFWWTADTVEQGTVLEYQVNCFEQLDLNNCWLTLHQE